MRMSLSPPTNRDNNRHSIVCACILVLGWSLPLICTSGEEYSPLRYRNLNFKAMESQMVKRKTKKTLIKDLQEEEQDC